MSKRLPKTATQQYEEMLNFVKQNRTILSGKTKPLEAKKIGNLWEQFAQEINSKGIGPIKSGLQWRNVWNEWKTNTKRKSRQIQLNLEGTGGGPPTNKSLTDLENQLLDLISKIHLGDPAVLDTFNKENEEPSQEEITVVWEDAPEDNYDSASGSGSKEIPERKESKTILYEIQNEARENIEDQSEVQNESLRRPKSPFRTPNKIEISTPKVSNSKYTTSLLSSACENYAEAQKQSVEYQKLQAEGLTELAKALNKHALVLEEKNRIEKMKLKFEYLKHFGNLDDFTQLE